MGDERDPGMEKSRLPTRRQGAIWTERSLLALIVASVAVTFNLLLAVHRQALTPVGPLDSETKISQTAPVPNSSKPVARSQVAAGDSGGTKPAIAQKPPEGPKDRPAPEDPTKKVVAGLTVATSREIGEAERSDGRAMALETARLASVAESRRWKRRELLVRQQIAGLTDRANQMESEADSLDAERDVLAHERDALKAALVKAGRRSGYAVLPYKGPNGTWRRPIVLECTAGSVKLQPQGVAFSSMELSPLVNPRASPLVRAVARELLHVQAADTPDGAPAVPYLVFLVRPSGIRPYYEARTCLEPLGIAFGYELIQQDLVVDIPNFDNLVTWDGSVPLDLPLQTAPERTTTVAVKSRSGGGNGTAAGSQSGSQGNRSSFNAWPAGSDRAGNTSSGDQGNRDAASPEDFVWPTRGRQNGGGGSPSAGSYAADSHEGSLNQEDVGRSAPGTVGSPSGFPPSGSGTGAFGNRQLSLPANFGAGDAPGSLTAGSGGAGGMGGSGRPAGGSGSGLGSAGANGSSLGSAGGNGSSLGSAGGSGSSLGSAGGNGSSLGSAGGSGSSFGSAGDTNSGSNSIARGSRNIPALGQPPSSTGAGSGDSGGGPNSLPDLEPIGDSDSSITAQPHSAGSPGGLSDGRLAQGGQLQSSGPGQVGFGATSPTGSGSTPSIGNSGAAVGAGTYVQGRDSATGGLRKEGGDPSTEAFSGQTTSPLTRLQGSMGSVGGSGLAANEGQAGQPAGGSELSSAAPPSGLVSAPSSGVSAPAFEMPLISSSPVSSNSSPGGIPMSSSSTTSSSSSSSSLFGQDGSSRSDSSDNDRIFAPAPKREPPQGSIEVPFEIVIVCRQGDLLLHPGGYRLTTQAMRAKGASKEGLLVRELLAMVRKRAIVDPMIRPKPRLKFLVESNGSETYWTARRQLLFALPDWPMSLQVSGSHESHVFTKETW